MKPSNTTSTTHLTSSAPHSTHFLVTISEAHPLWLRRLTGAEPARTMTTSFVRRSDHGWFDPLLSIGLTILSQTPSSMAMSKLDAVDDIYGISAYSSTTSILPVFPNIGILIRAPLMLTCVYEISPWLHWEV